MWSNQENELGPDNSILFLHAKDRSTLLYSVPSASTVRSTSLHSASMPKSYHRHCQRMLEPVRADILVA